MAKTNENQGRPIPLIVESSSLNTYSSPTVIISEKNKSPLIPPTNIADSISDAGSPVRQIENEVKNSKFEVAWSNVMGKGLYKSPSCYKKAAVLLLSWERDADNMNVENEVNELREVFQDLFHFEIKRDYLKPSSPTQGASLKSRVSGIISQFINTFDDHNSLLIVYYAGHARPSGRKGDLALARCSDTAPHMDAADIDSLTESPGENTESVIWYKAEELLKDANADVLEIFDCCYAGLLQSRTEHREFDYLAATGAGGLTRFPGKESFTAALIWSLRKLRKEQPEGRFTTYELYRTIKDSAPDFPRDRQNPELHPRRRDHKQAGCIMLHPIIQNSNLVKDIPSPAKEIVTLKFWFGDHVSEKVLVALGARLNEFVNQHNFHINRIAWAGWESIDAKYVAKWMLKTQRRCSNLSATSDQIDPLGQWLEDARQQAKENPFLEQPCESLTGGGAGYHFRMLISIGWDSVRESKGLMTISTRKWIGAWMIVVLAVLLGILRDHTTSSGANERHSPSPGEPYSCT